MGWRSGGFGTALLTVVCAAAVDAIEPLWPLDASPVLTSSFGEPRSTHLHAGIDLGTGGRTGVPCFAVHDGWVARMRMSPFGYGKALYIQLETGELAVYAHLDRFAAPIAQRAWLEQKKRGRYSFDLYLEPREIPVQRGQVIAWSGETGVGYPHLHFETRHGDAPFNPQTGGFAVPDAVTPTIHDVSILALDARSHVDGESKRRTLRVANAATLTEPVVAAGRLGFAVRSVDRAGPGPYRQAPFRYEVRIDGRTLYRAQHEHFDYAQNHHIVLDYDQERLVRFDVNSFLLFVRPGNQLPSRLPLGGSRGVLLAAVAEAAGVEAAAVAGPGEHEVEIEVADVSGRTRSVRFPLIVSRPPSIDVLTQHAAAGSLQVECEASDPDGDALALALHASRNGGATWQGVDTVRGGTDAFWTARVAAEPGARIAWRARVADATGLEAVRTLVEPAGTPASDSLHVDVGTRWEYGRLRVEIDSERLLVQAPSLWLQRPDGQRRKMEGVVQRGERRWIWERDVADLEDVDALVVAAADLDGRRRIVREPMPARIVRRGSARIVDDMHPQLVLEFESATLLEDVALRGRVSNPAKLKLGPELEPAGLCFAVEPGAAALDEPVRVRVRRHSDATATNGDAETPGHVGLFVRNRRGLRFLTADPDPSGDFVGSTRFLGTFVLLRDATPPLLHDFRAVASGGRAPRLQFSVRDRGADLAADALDVDIDGVVAIPEWDPETGRVRVHPTADLAAGSHRLSVRAVDRVGNRSTRDWK